MAYSLPALPYAYDALEPHIDARTMEIHHTKHHQAYVNNMNAALEKHPELQKQSIVSLIAAIDIVPEDIRTTLRNNGGGYLNHNLFFSTIGPQGGGEPAGKLAESIDANFGGFDAFKKEFTAAAMSVFGSGWAWLTRTPDQTLLIETTPNQDSPLMTGHTPLVGLDVWEHAYYLKYRNRRVEYVENWWNVVNWHNVANIFVANLGM